MKMKKIFTEDIDEGELEEVPKLKRKESRRRIRWTRIQPKAL